jgi:hypothetical protein
MSEIDRLTSLIATPIIITNHMDDEEFAYEFELMKIRSQAAADFIHGEITVDDYLDTLAECEIDVDDALECWTEGGSLMGDR